MPVHTFAPSPYTSARTSARTSPTRQQRASMAAAGAAAGLANNAAGLATSIKQLGHKPRPAIEVKLTDAQQDAFTPAYTSLDEINGEASIIAQTDLSFDDIYITFEGSTTTFVEKIATTSPTNGRTQAFQNFLRLQQPLDRALWPENKILKAGQTYRFPFVFVVPESLLPQSCKHPKGPNFPEGAHLNLPPSLGDPMVASVGKQLMDDMAPEMGNIKYSVKCRLTDGKGPSGKYRVLAEGTKKLRIIPAVEEAPPLSVEGGNIDDYKLRKEKSIRKGLFRQKLGCIIMESVQPKSLRLPPLRSEDGCTATTMATVKLRFDPHDEKCQPPKLQSLESKLKAATFYASQPLRELPAKSSDFHFSSVKGIFVDSVPLFRRCVENTEWHQHGVSEMASQSPTDPGWSSDASDIPKASEVYNPKYPFYTAQVSVPIALPKGNKVFVPSFHTCLVSRIYALDLTLSVETPNTNIKDPTLHIKLPIQVSSEASPRVKQPLTGQQIAAIASQQASEFFEPRNIAPPIPDLTERASIMGSARSSPRIRFGGPFGSNRNSIAATDPSPFSSPTVQRDSIAEDSQWEAGTTRSHPSSSALAYTPRLSTDQEIPPSPGPGWSHRASIAPEESPTYSATATAPNSATRIPLPQTQQRFQSLSFENEDAAMAPPPGYDHARSLNRGRTTSPTAELVVPARVSGTGVAQVRSSAEWAELTGERPR